MNTKYKKTGAELTTITYDREKIEAPTKNIYEAITLIAKRSRQINDELKEELQEKLKDFIGQNDGIIEEVFENKEQIEISKFYDSLPKPHAIAIEEWLNKKLQYRY